MNIYKQLKGYPKWGELLGVVAKLRWFEKNNYLVGFCYNNNYDYDEIKMFLKISSKIIDGELDLYMELKDEQKKIKNNAQLSNVEIEMLDAVLE